MLQSIWYAILDGNVSKIIYHNQQLGGTKSIL